MTALLDASDYGTLARLLTSFCRKLLHLESAVLAIDEPDNEPVLLAADPAEAKRTAREILLRIGVDAGSNRNGVSRPLWTEVAIAQVQLTCVQVTLSIGELRTARLVGWRKRDAEQHTPIAESRLIALCAAAAGTLDRLQTRNALSIARDRTYALETVSRDLTRDASVDDLLLVATRAMRRAARADGVLTYLFHDPKRPPESAAFSGMDMQSKERLSADRIQAPTEVPIEARVLERNRPIVIEVSALEGPHLRPAVSEFLRAESAGHLIVLPIQHIGHPLGVSYAYRRMRRSKFGDGDVRAAESILAQLANRLHRHEPSSGTFHALDRTRKMLDFARTLNRETEPKAIARLLDQAIRRDVPDIDVTVSLSVDQRSTMLDNGATTLLAPVKQSSSTEILLPLVDSDRHFGNVMITPRDGESLTRDERSLIEAYISQTTTALNRAILSTEADRHAADLNNLQRFSKLMASRLNMRQTFDIIIGEIERMIECHAGAIHIADPDNGVMQTIAVWGNIDRRSYGKGIPIEHSIIGAVYRSGEPVLLSDIHLDSRAHNRQDATWRSFIAVPLATSGANYGTLFVGHEEPGAYRERDLRLVNLIATQTASAIYQAHQDERLRTLYRSSVEALALAVDAKDAKTHDHSRRVATIGMRIARTLELPDEEIERIELAGLLHDIGKIGIPDRILGKPRALDQDERVVMMSHATLGANILSSHPDLLDLAPLVRHHHERYDGRGYPDGLQRDEIPIGAAILCVADAFETMTTDRPYRAAMAIAEARAELVDQRGKQFHPHVVDALLKSIDSDERFTGNLVVKEHSSSLPKISPIQAEDVIGLRVLTRVAGEIGQLSNGVEFLQRVEQIIEGEFPCTHALIWLFDDQGKRRGADRMRRYTGGPPYVSAPEIGVEDLLLGEVMINDRANADTRYAALDSDPHSALLVPLILEGAGIGLIELIFTDALRLDSYLADLLTALAGQLAPTIRLATLHDDWRKAAVTDELTGARNRRGFYQQIESWLRDPKLADGLQVILIDVIGLKHVNDTAGHVSGDLALQAISDVLHERTSSHGLVSRYGGDEFVVILPGPVQEPLENVVARLEEPVGFVDHFGEARKIRLRCGAASYRGAESVRELVARADERLYARVGPTPRTA